MTKGIIKGQPNPDASSILEVAAAAYANKNNPISHTDNIIWPEVIDNSAKRNLLQEGTDFPISTVSNTTNNEIASNTTNATLSPTTQSFGNRVANLTDSIGDNLENLRDNVTENFREVKNSTENLVNQTLINATQNPTNQPSVAPTSGRPTAQPSFAPTVQPTLQPSVAPTSARPTNQPSVAPTSGRPTLQPSVAPTTQPTQKPSAELNATNTQVSRFEQECNSLVNSLNTTAANKTAINNATQPALGTLSSDQIKVICDGVRNNSTQAQVAAAANILVALNPTLRNQNAAVENQIREIAKNATTAETLETFVKGLLERTLSPTTNNPTTNNPTTVSPTTLNPTREPSQARTAGEVLDSSRDRAAAAFQGENQYHTYGGAVAGFVIGLCLTAMCCLFCGKRNINNDRKKLDEFDNLIKENDQDGVRNFIKKNNIELVEHCVRNVKTDPALVLTPILNGQAEPDSSLKKCFDKPLSKETKGIIFNALNERGNGVVTIRGAIELAEHPVGENARPRSRSVRVHISKPELLDDQVEQKNERRYSNERQPSGVVQNPEQSPLIVSHEERSVNGRN